MRSAGTSGTTAAPEATTVLQPERLPLTAPRAHHHISEDRRNGLTIRAYLEVAKDCAGGAEDPAVKVSESTQTFVFWSSHTIYRTLYLAYRPTC